VTSRSLYEPHPERLGVDDPNRSAILAAHREAIDSGSAGYLDPSTDVLVLTAAELLSRRGCCDQGCRHCPDL
jgi:Family of unknown function (DUF5522)